MEDELRMYLVVRKDLALPIGKAMGQAGHAFSTALRQASELIVSKYCENNQPKIVIGCKNLNALFRAETEIKAANINCFLVTDAGRTVFPEPTQTCMAIGPCYRDELPKFVQGMQLL